MSGRPLLVVNPASGGGKTGKTFESLRSTIQASLGPVRVAFTDRRGHAIELAKQGVEDGHPLIVAVGGDGTFHEVVNGVMDSGKKARVGLIAQGTGGDFRKTLGLEHRLDHYLSALTSGRTRDIDVGRVTYRELDGTEKKRWFVNILSAGMGGLVDKYVAEAPSFLGGKAAYFAASFGALVKTREGRVKAKVGLDGKTEEKRLRSFMIAICNGQYFGGGMKVTPNANVGDGLFDVTIWSGYTLSDFIFKQGGIYKGTHLSFPGTQARQCREAVCEADDEVLIDCDGEQPGRLPCRVTMLPAAIRLKV